MKPHHFIITMMVAFFLLGGLMVYLCNFLENKIALQVGRKVVLENDTLLIIDYSTINETYTLDNGKEVSFKLIGKLRTVK